MTLGLVIVELLKKSPKSSKDSKFASRDQVLPFKDTLSFGRLLLMNMACSLFLLVNILQ